MVMERGTLYLKQHPNRYPGEEELIRQKINVLKEEMRYSAWLTNPRSKDAIWSDVLDALGQLWIVLRHCCVS